MFPVFFFFFKQKTAYELRISDWSSDLCSSDLTGDRRTGRDDRPARLEGTEPADGTGPGHRIRLPETLAAAVCRRDRVAAAGSGATLGLQSRSGDGHVRESPPRHLRRPCQ